MPKSADSQSKKKRSRRFVDRIKSLFKKKKPNSGLPTGTPQNIVT